MRNGQRFPAAIDELQAEETACRSRTSRPGCGCGRRSSRANRAPCGPYLRARQPQTSCADFDDQRQLPLLVVHGHRIAHEIAGEAALRAETQLIERQVLRRLVDAALEDVLRSRAPASWSRRGRGSTCLPFGTCRSGVKSPARSVSYSMKKLADVDVAEHDFADVLVAAAAHPFAAVVAAAHVHAEHHVLRHARGDAVEHAGVRLENPVRIVAARPVAPSWPRGSQISGNVTSSICT